MVNKKIVLGIIALTIALASVTLIINNEAKFQIDEDKTRIYVKIDNKFLLGGTEYDKLFNGSKEIKKTASLIATQYSQITNTTTIQRTSFYPNNITLSHMYLFDGNEQSIAGHPKDAGVVVTNAKGLVYRYEVTSLNYTGPTTKLNGNSFLFGRKTLVEWELGYYSATLYSSKSLRILYDINSDLETFRVRLSDPPQFNTSYAGIVAFNLSQFRENESIEINLTAIGITCSNKNCSDVMVLDQNGDELKYPDGQKAWQLPLDNVSSRNFRRNDRIVFVPQNNSKKYFIQWSNTAVNNTGGSILLWEDNFENYTNGNNPACPLGNGSVCGADAPSATSSICTTNGQKAMCVQSTTLARWNVTTYRNITVLWEVNNTNGSTNELRFDMFGVSDLSYYRLPESASPWQINSVGGLGAIGTTVSFTAPQLSLNITSQRSGSNLNFWLNHTIKGGNVTDNNKTINSIIAFVPGIVNKALLSLKVYNTTIQTFGSPSQIIIFPEINVTNPRNITYSSLIVNLTFTTGCSGAPSTCPTYPPISQCWYTMDSYQTNVSLPSCNNITSIVGNIPSPNQNKIIVCANDTSNNIGCSNPIFFTANDTRRATYTNLTINDFSVNKTWEHGTNVVVNLSTNLTGSGVTVCLDVYQAGFGYSYTCGNNGMSLNLTLLSGVTKFNTTTEAHALSYIGSQNKTIYIRMNKYDVLNNGTILFTGIFNGSYPSNIKVDVANDSTYDILISGNLSGLTVSQNQFNDSSTTTNMTFNLNNQRRNTYVKIPKNAVVSSASVNLTYRTDDTIYNNFNFTTGSSVHFVKNDTNFFTFLTTKQVNKYSTSGSQISSCIPGGIGVPTTGQTLDMNSTVFIEGVDPEIGATQIRTYTFDCVLISTLFSTSVLDLNKGLTANTTALWMFNNTENVTRWNFPSGTTANSSVINIRENFQGSYDLDFNGTHFFVAGISNGSSMVGIYNEQGVFIRKFNVSQSAIRAVDTDINYTWIQLLNPALGNPILRFKDLQPPLNISLDTGSDDAVDFNFTGVFSGSRTIDLNATAINNFLANCTADINGFCTMPIPVTVVNSPVRIELRDLNMVYRIGSFSLNMQAIRSYLDSSPTNVTDIPVRIEATGGNLNVENLSIVMNGSSVFNITARFVGNYTINVSSNTTWVKVVYSNFNRSLPYTYTNYTLFSGITTNSTQNATPQGQTNTTPHFNISGLNYELPALLYISLNQTSTCLNITASNTSSKSNGFILNTTPQLMLNFTLAKNYGVWFWADLNNCPTPLPVNLIPRTIYSNASCSECVIKPR